MKRATLKDVADLAGVSKATVSYVLNGSKKTISEETKERVKKAASDLGYVPNLGAAALTSQTTKLIGVVVPQMEPGSAVMFQNSFYGEIISAIEYHARKKGYHLLVSGTNLNETYMKLVMERNLDGVIAIGVFPDSFFAQFKELDVPIVLIDSYCEEGLFHNIRIDDEMGGFLATEYLLKKGHRKVGLVTGALQENGVIQKRLAGYQRALQAFDIPFRREFVFDGEVSFRHGVVSAQRIVDEKIPLTALAATADVLSIGIIRGFSDKGLRVPEDYSVIGFDDLEIARYMTPALTTVHQDIGEKGVQAVEILSKCMENPGYEVFDQELPLSIVERESVRPVED